MPKSTLDFRIVNAAMRQVHTLEVREPESFRQAVATALTWLDTYREKVNPRAYLSVRYAGSRWKLTTARHGYAWIEQPGQHGGYGQWAALDVLTS